MSRLILWLFVASGMVLSACGGKTGDSDTTPAVPDATEVAVVEVETPSPDLIRPEDAPEAEVWRGPDPIVGEPCETHEHRWDCSGCLEVFEGINLRTTECEASKDCPDGWACFFTHLRIGEAWLCFPVAMYSCMPCAVLGDCSYTTACLASGLFGDVCAQSCEYDDDCLAGYECVDGETTEGDVGRFCVPAGGTTCSCSPEAVQVGVQASCTLENELGVCHGVRRCLADGSISSCDAQMPAPEECTGVDDDCDGETDEGCN